MKMQMPRIAVEVLDGEERWYAERITRNGVLRASKPKVKDLESAKVALVWRMVAFFASPNPRHHHMPVMASLEAEAYMTGSWEERQAEVSRLIDLANRIVDAVEPTEWHGVARWARALGYRMAG